jgi:hypothetical protein
MQMEIEREREGERGRGRKYRLEWTSSEINLFEILSLILRKKKPKLNSIEFEFTVFFLI